jgi:subtilisin family serine protease
MGGVILMVGIGGCMDATRWSVLSLVTSLLFLSLAGCNEGKINEATANCTSQAIPNSYLVRWNGKVPAEYEQNKLAPNSLTTRFNYTNKSAVERDVLSKHPNEYLVAESDFQIRNINEEQNKVTGVTPNDNSATWGTGDIQASAAWSYLNSQGAGVIVAVVDSGADLNHPLLAGQFVAGLSYVGSPTDLSDGADHGTHVSGIIAGLPDQTSGFSGVAPGAKIMPIKFIDSTGAGSVGDAISGTAYAISKGAKVINASWGGDQCSSALQQEIADFTDAGAVFANAAGNSGNNLATAPEYPAVYQVPGKITIGSYNIAENLSTFSNYGSLVDLAAPGEVILSTIPPTAGQAEGQMGVKSGTSMATPFVAGVAALLFSAKPNATPVQIAAAINAGVVSGNFGVRTGGHLSALLAAQYLMTH